MTAENQHAPAETAGSAPQPPPPPPPPEAPAASAPTGPIAGRHLVTVLLALLPGLGHVANGLYLRGIKFFLVALAAVYLATEVGLAGMAVAFVWLFNVIDAWRQATLIEQGQRPDAGLADGAKPVTPVQAGLFWGGGIFLLGFLLLLDHTLGFEMRRVWEFWPLGLLVAGGWLMVGALLQRRRDRAAQDAAAGSDATV